jgi:hypothetical protein
VKGILEEEDYANADFDGDNKSNNNKEEISKLYKRMKIVRSSKRKKLTEFEREKFIRRAVEEHLAQFN